MATPSKHVKGKGSLSPLPDGRWFVKVFVDDGKGGKVRVQKRVPTYPEALALQSRLLTEGKAAMDAPLEPVQVAYSEDTVNALLDRWLLEEVKNTRRRTTYVNYVYVLERHVRPVLGDYVAAALTRADVLNWTAGLATRVNPTNRRTLAPRSQHLVFTVFKAAMGWARKVKAIPSTPFEDIKGPRFEFKEFGVWSPEQMKLFLTSVAEDPKAPLYETLLGTGMRIGEALALTWSDVDLVNGQITVTKQVVEISKAEGEAERGRSLVTEVKTKAGRRSFQIIHPRTLKALRSQRAALEKNGILAKTNLVFPSSSGVHLLKSNVRREFNRWIKKLGLPQIRIHDLRHTFATALLAGKEAPNFVQGLLGHSDIKVTLGTYAHRVPSMSGSARNTLGPAFDE